MTADDLRAFEAGIADEFNAGHIKAPVHLSDGNEEQLIQYFKGVYPGDWICGSWRMHYQCLLAGVPPAELKAEIMAGRSISLCFPERRIVSSAMVGGILPIALGIAMALDRSGDRRTVHCFMGDMTGLTGMASECIRYADNFKLPIVFVFENNELSVCSVTREVWGLTRHPSEYVQQSTKVYQYSYESKWPHAGAGKRVQF